ncbi:MAG: anthranilate synthase component I [Pseudanabaenaceae cyanobacterium]|jgi:para-aminobenzoate synthetase component 1
MWHKYRLQDGLSGAAIWEALFHQDLITVLLESPVLPQNHPEFGLQSKLARYSIAAGSPQTNHQTNQLWTPPVGEILPCLKQLQEQSKFNLAQQLRNSDQDISEIQHLPFIGGYLGWLGYDLAWEIERLPYTKPDNLPFPVAFWYEPASFAVVDHEQNIAWLFGAIDWITEAVNRLDQWDANLIRATSKLDHLTSETGLHQQVTFIPNQTDYEAMVITAQNHIYMGDIFQANLSLRYQMPWNGDGWALYQRLHQMNPSPFASYWRTPWGEVISVSPERLVKLQNQVAASRPIAGTRPRGQTAAGDLVYADELINSTKDQAEHIMLVDLERNDLGKVCEWGTVRVDELLIIERYSHVMHLVSNVIGNLAPNHDEIDLIRALFPGGTITGCPKVRCMEIIEKLEPQRRSLFYGSCGYLDARGHLDLNILIRTMVKYNRDDVSYICGQVGAGIVADSVPTKEWFESLQKAQAQLKALGLINVENYSS